MKTILIAFLATLLLSCNDAPIEKDDYHVDMNSSQVLIKNKVKKDSSQIAQSIIKHKNKKQ